MLPRHRHRLLVRRQHLDQRLVQPRESPVHEPERRDRRHHLGDRRDREPGVERDRDAEPAMGEAAGVLEDRGPVPPGDRHAPEGVGGDLPVEPGPELERVHLSIVGRRSR